jgi:hypothetical protein
MTIARSTLFFLSAAILVAGVASAAVAPDWAVRSSVNGSGAQGIAVDEAGNAYVAVSVPRGAHSNIGIIKYDAAGTELWAREAPGIGLGFDGATAIAITSDGKIVVTGYSWRGPTALNYEIVTRAYSPVGDTLWVARFNGVSSREDRPAAIATDGNGNTYVAGYANATAILSTAGRAFVTIKYGPTGALLWYWTYAGNWTSGANALALDARGNAYVTGGIYENNPSLEDYLTIKYTSAGAFAWASRYAGPTANNDEAKAIAVDDSGSVYVTGAGSDWDIATVKYDSLGVQRWAKRYDGLAHLVDAGVGIGVDGSHDVYVTGRETVVGGSSDWDIVTMKYSGAGDSLWVRHYDGPLHSYDEPVALRVDGAGNSLVLGSSYGAGITPYSGFKDYLTLGYGPGGDLAWEERYAGPGDGDDFATAMAVGVDGSIHVTGTSTDYLPGTASAGTIKYSRPTADVATGGGPRSNAALVSWNHPNPFPSATTIHFEMALSGRVSLKVYDLQGREVAALVEGTRAAGAHAVRWDASALSNGVYFYKLRAGERETTRRMVVMR